ncbi:uncharacterized protein LOC132734507 [Ruditapes philippinarum]|uniref:uncharacterized protein LOC132734507 n=1 Tax=Ruditapes philippinarum TaxID=129788 RepID=UPI00295AA684|nr:uncharacterized protein LOC132734507 [Ruditapes philippinarum]
MQTKRKYAKNPLSGHLNRSEKYFDDMSSIVLPSTPTTLHHHPDHRFHSYRQKARNDEFSLENLGIRRNEKLKSVLQGLEHCKRYLENTENRQPIYFGHINRKLYDKIINMFIQHKQTDERIILGNKLSRIGMVDTLAEVYDFVRNAIKIQGLTDARTRDTEDDGIKLLLTIRKIFNTLTSLSDNVVRSLSETEIYRALLEDLHCVTKQDLLHLDKIDLADENSLVLSSAINILYECVRHPFTKKEKFRQSGIIVTVLLFLSCKNAQFRLRSVLILCYVLTENQMFWSEIHLDFFDILCEAINEALLAKDRRVYGFSISELLNGLKALQFCFPDKLYFMNKHPLPLINCLLASPDQSDVLAAVNVVWELAFCEQNRKEIQENEDIIECIEDLSHSNNTAKRFSAKRTLFVLVDQGKRIRRTGLASRKDVSGQHILICYNMSDQKTALKVYHSLSSYGFPVWIDIAELNKYSDSLDAVLRAIEQASHVVVCFSENYASDQSCRMEAEYAFTLKKRIIPLKLQTGYEPVGWITSVLGSRFYLTLTRDRSFEKQMNNLRDYIRGSNTTSAVGSPISRSMSRAYMSRGPSRAISRGISRASTSMQSSCPVYDRKVVNWNTDDVILWATQFKLEGRAWRIVSKFSVKQILYVYNVWRKVFYYYLLFISFHNIKCKSYFSKAPDYFYRWVESVIGLGSVEDLMRFRNAVRSLKDYI